MKKKWFYLVFLLIICAVLFIRPDAKVLEYYGGNSKKYYIFQNRALFKDVTSLSKYQKIDSLKVDFYKDKRSVMLNEGFIKFDVEPNLWVDDSISFNIPPGWQLTQDTNDAVLYFKKNFSDKASKYNEFEFALSVVDFDSTVKITYYLEEMKKIIERVPGYHLLSESSYASTQSGNLVFAYQSEEEYIVHYRKLVYYGNKYYIANIRINAFMYPVLDDFIQVFLLNFTSPLARTTSADLGLQHKSYNAATSSFYLRTLLCKSKSDIK